MALPKKRNRPPATSLFVLAAITMTSPLLVSDVSSQPAALTWDDRARIEDALTWPVLAEELRAEGTDDGVIDDLITLGRGATQRGVSAGLILQSVKTATIRYGPIPQAAEVVRALVSQATSGGELRDAIGHAYIEAASREGSGEVLEGSGVGALVDGRRGANRQMGRPQPGDGARAREAEAHYGPGPGQQGTGVGPIHPGGDPRQHAVSDRPAALQWAPGTAPGGAEDEPEWVPGSGRGGRPRTPTATPRGQGAPQDRGSASDGNSAQGQPQ